MPHVAVNAFSLVDDLAGVLDATSVERAALVGLSLGGGLALDAALAHPDRVWAIAHVAGGVTGMPVDPYTEEQTARFDAAVARGDLEAAAEIDFAVWAPLGTKDELRELWLSTPEALGVPDGTELRRPEPAHDRLDQISVPTLVVLATHDPPELREVGTQVARQIPGARLVDVESDHYLTVREPERVTRLLEDFLVAAAPR